MFTIKKNGVGLNLNENSDKTSNLFGNILLYADDIVLLTSNEDDMQFLLNMVEIWCTKWRLEVKLTKNQCDACEG